MPYKVNISPYYQCRIRNLPGYGDTTRISSRTKNKRAATDMENLLRDIAEWALYEPRWLNLLDAVCKEKSITLPDLLAAKHQDRLVILRDQIRDPLVVDAIKDLNLEAMPKARRLGLIDIANYVSPKMRMSKLEGDAIQELLETIEREKGVKRNTVHRFSRQALSWLLQKYLGTFRRDQAFADVDYTREDDTRRVHLTPAEIAQLIAAARKHGHPEMPYAIQLSLLTSADRGDLFAGPYSGGKKYARGLLVRDCRILHDPEADEYFARVTLHGTKTTSRTRPTLLNKDLSRWLAMAVAGKEPEQAVFSETYEGMDYHWKRIREIFAWQGPEKWQPLRFKDLRHMLSHYAPEAGIPEAVVQFTYGHTSSKSTNIYRQHDAQVSQDQVNRLSEIMFGRLGS